MPAANGTIAPGKSLTHIESGANCEILPCGLGLEPAVSVDHAEVTGSCSSCHNGTIATGKSLTHIESSANCESCHAVSAWEPAVMSIMRR